MGSLITVVLVVLAGGSLFAYNQFVLAQDGAPVAGESGNPEPVAAVAPEADDTSAIDALVLSIGALFGYAESGSTEDCKYVDYLYPQVAEATPLESYRGTYEKIASQMESIASRCFIDPTDESAIHLAVTTRPLVAGILDDRKAMGMTNWAAGARPEPYSQTP
jgi:hypothetical protein